ncbi:MAG TPA: 3-deoxy-manno-octulosonate cytidylyltransferase [Acidiferrobacteraceae bacterium]|nr:3-deoxy-manno-octulosonate cytidylyltransferase [Acidiferrobacteraceae bacterium]
MAFIVIIPARYGSTRLAGKALVDICGQPMIQRVYDCAFVGGAGRVIVATDDPRIADTVTGFGGEACMTSDEHPSGTDRIAEVIERLDIDTEEIIVNLQGDEPLMPGSVIEQVVTTLQDTPLASMSTTCHRIEDPEQLSDVNAVKVVVDKSGMALYFSRAPIPWDRNQHDTAQIPQQAYRHIGLYAYRAKFVLEMSKWGPCQIEQIERLEQLRVLWHGRKIAVCIACRKPGPGVDTAEDLKKVIRILEEKLTV